MAEPRRPRQQSAHPPPGTRRHRQHRCHPADGGASRPRSAIALRRAPRSRPSDLAGAPRSPIARTTPHAPRGAPNVVPTLGVKRLKSLARAPETAEVGLDLGAGGALTLVGGPDAGQTVDFLGNNATLDLLPAGDFGGHISGFGAHDLIDLANTIVNHQSFFGGVLTLSDGLIPVAHLNFNGAYSTSSFSLSADRNGGTLIHFV